MLQLDFVKPPDPAADKHAVAIRIARAEVDTGLHNRLFGSHHCELRKAIGATQIASIHLQVTGGVELPNFAAEANLKFAAVESFHQADAAFTATHSVPDVVQFAAKRGDNAKACHHYSTA
jgi:hypothetical protein